jgi:hypothetical protein
MLIIKKNYDKNEATRLPGKVVKTKRRTIYAEQEGNVVHVFPMSQVLEQLFQNKYA